MKRQPAEREKIFASSTSGEKLISRIHKEHIQFNNIKKRKSHNLKINNRSKQTFLKGRHINGCQACEKMLNITNNYGNATQNYNEISLTPV